MADPQTGIRPNGFMDFDSTDTEIKDGNYRYALNIENGFAYIGQQRAASNLKGMIPVGYTFATNVTYKVLGTREDKKSSTVVYFVWASDNNHCILRYYRKQVSTANPYGVIQNVINYNFGWTKDTPIHSSEVINTTVDGVLTNLLYWTDNIGPRKINLTKANVNNKFKSWDIYTYTSFAPTLGYSFVVTVSDLNGNILNSQSLNVFGPNAQTSYSQLAAQLNNPINGFSQYITAEACTDHLHITEVKVNSYIINFGNSVFKVVPSNFYGYNLIDRFFDLAKWPGDQQPNPSYQQDPNTKVNKVQQIPFQFAIQLFYDDFEQSVLSPISPIAIDNIDSGLYENDLYNYIQILFNNQYLQDPNSWVLVKRVSIMVREHNDGTWNQVMNDWLPNFYDMVGGIPTLTYKFYNNESKIPIGSYLNTTQYDLVPISANTLKYVKNTLIMGGVTSGRSAVACPNMSLEINGGTNPQQPLRTISGGIRIFTPSMRFNDGNNLWNNGYWTSSGVAIGSLYREPTIFDTNRGCELNGLICHNSTMIIPPGTVANPNPAPYPQTPFSWYGGIGYRPDNNGDIDIQVQVYNEYDQRLPEGGWAVYAAGTPYFAISRQNNLNLQTSSDGAVDISSGSSTTSTSEGILADQNILDTIKQRFSSGNNNNVGSSWELKVPPGIYIIRLPSHWCSYGDKLSKGQAYDLYGKSWQKTSTPIWGCLDVNNNWYGGQQEFIVDCRYGDVEAGTFVVLDAAPSPGYNFSNGSKALPWTNFFGYLYDCDGRLDARSETWNGVPVELAGITIFNTGETYTEIGQSLHSFNKTCQAFTDHNGFFFLVGDNYNGSNSVLNNDNILGFDARSVDNFQLRQIATPAYKGNLNDIINKTFNILPLTPDINQLYNVILTTDQSNSTGINPRNACMTFVEGKVLDQDNQACGGINVVMSKGNLQYTDENGEYAIRAWGNAKQLITNVQFNDPDSRIIAGTFGGVASIASSFFISQIVWYLNPIGTVQGRTDVSLAFSNISQFNFSSLPAIISFNGITQYASNPVNQINTSPFSPTSIWSNGTINIIRNQYYISKGKKLGGKYTYAIRYQDQAGRQCSVITNDGLSINIPFDTEDWNTYFPTQYPPNTYLPGPASLLMNISHKPPIWADTYTIMRTKEKNFASYLDWIINDVEYVQRIAGSGTTTDFITSYENKDATHIRINIANLAYYQAEFSQSRVAYTWNSGDRLRMKWDNNLNYFEGLFDYQIVLFESPGYIYIPFTQDIPQIFSGTGIEIYTPNNTVESDAQIYYEVGISYPCTNPNNPNNAHSVTSIPLIDGDCYFRPRSIPVYDTNFDYVQDYPTIIQDQSISDFYQSNDSDIGRRGEVDPYFVQQYLPTVLRPSQTFIYNTESNGLSTFPPLNDVVLDPSYGDIRKLETSGLTLIVVGQNKVDAYYLGATLGAGQDGSGILVLSESLLGNERPLEPSYGSSNPESIASYDDKGYKYGWDAARGIAWRYASNGLIEISDYYARSYFAQFKQIPVWSSPGTFDVLKKKYILTIYIAATAQCPYIGTSGNNLTIDGSAIPSAQVGDTLIVNGTLLAGETVSVSAQITAIDSGQSLYTLNMGGVYLFTNPGGALTIQYKGPGTTIAFSEDKNGWDTFYSFTPDCYGTIDNQALSFLNGNLFLHDLDQDVTNSNNFYGVKYPSRITLVYNVAPQEIKNWWAILLDQLQDDSGNDWFCPVVSNPKGQLSNVPNVNFQFWFQFWHSFFLRDQHTPNKQYPLIEGNLLQSNTLTVELENPSNTHFILVESRVNFSSSRGTTK